LLTRNHRQEALSRAYVQAVAACAGLGLSRPDLDYGIDLSLHAIVARGRRRVDAGSVLDVQIKSTARAVFDETSLAYDLETKTYDDLRATDARRIRILVLVVLPDDEAEWLSQTEEELTIRGQAYWLSLRGAPARAAKKTVRIRIPRSNVFSVPAVRELLDRLDRGEVLWNRSP
jgi:hypothetical protein